MCLSFSFHGATAEAGGPKIEFCAGRADAESGATSDPQDRLPGADKGSRKATAQHVRDVSGVLLYISSEKEHLAVTLQMLYQTTIVFLKPVELHCLFILCFKIFYRMGFSDQEVSENAIPMNPVLRLPPPHDIAI